MDTMTVEAPASAPAATPSSAESSEPKEVRIVDEREQEARAEADLDQKLAKVFREAKRDRAEDGKFASKDPKPAKAEKAPTEDAAAKALANEKPAEKPVKTPNTEAKSTEAQPEKPAPKVEAPKWWDEKVKAKFADLPPETAKEIADAALKDRQAITKVGEYAKNAKPIIDTVQQFRDVFESKGLTYEQGLSQLLKAQQMLDRDPVQALTQIAKAYGIDLDGLSQGRGADPHAQALQRQLDAALDKISKLESRVVGREQQEREAGFNQRADVATRLAQELEGFDDLIDDMEPIIIALKRADPNKSDEAVLREAYERAAWGNPTFRSRRLEAETKAAEAKRAEEAKKAAEDARKANVLNVEGEPGSDVPSNIDDLLRSTFRKSQRK